MKINAVIFDWSGTISDDREPVYEANMRLFVKYGLPRLSFEQWQENSTQTAIEILKNYGAIAEPDEIAKLYEEFYTEEVECGRTPFIYPDAKDTLLHLKQKGKKLAVLSSHPQKNLEIEAGKYGVHDLFLQIRGSARDKTISLFHLMLELNESFPQTLYVGDTIFDIRAAKQACIPSAAKLGGYHSRQRLLAEKPDLVLETLSDLKDVFP
ncbi:MAG: HAD family hydrolase [Candidatus Aenigmatarchaeota archaeon]